MANAFTGDFDVVAECAMPAANRVLAAMQRVERFPHSMALHIDDKQPIRPVGGVNPVGVELVDAFGDPTTNHRRIGPPAALFGAGVGTNATMMGFDAIVNGDFVGATLGPIVPSNLSGKAQLQVSPPTIEVADAAAAKIRIRMQLMARYLADPGTAKLPEFFRGELQITTPLTQTIAQTGNIVEVDLKANSVSVVFVPAWSSAPLSAQDIAGLELAVHNVIKTAVLPSNVPLPSNIKQVAFKTLTGAQSALTMALRLRDGSANAAGVNNMFLSGSDDFAIAVGAEYVQAVLQPTADSILAQPVLHATLSYSIPYVHTFHISYTLTLNTAVFTLEPGNIVLTVTGHAHTDHALLPDFDFTVRFPFSLVPNGATASLVAGAISLDTSSWVVNMFRDAATSGMSTIRDQAVADSGANDTVNKSFDAQSVLGGILDALLEPISRRHFPIFYFGHRTTLAYSGIGISPDGIVLHGTVGVAPWAAANVEFEQIPADGGNRPVSVGMFPQGPDYSALKSWIPGGSIHEFEWSYGSASQPGLVDDNRFVYLQPPPAAESGVAARSTLISGFRPMCLTVRGTRVSASGLIAPQAVTGSVCSYSTFPVVGGVIGGKLSAMPMIAVTHPSANGLEVVGHTAALASGPGQRAPNLVVTRGANADRVAGIVRAVGDAKRPDAPTAILVIVPKGQLGGKTLADGAAYAEEDPAWDQLFGPAKSKSAETLIVGPDGHVHWRQEGEVDAAALAAALTKNLVPASTPQLSMLTASARLGHAPPNFLFEYAKGKQITIRKMAGRPTTMVFWRAGSAPSIDAVLELQRQASGGDGLLLAINDGDPAEVAAKTAASHKFTALVVPDPAREISAGYGVTVWPTVVSVDSFGVVSSIRYAKMENLAEGAKPSKGSGPERRSAKK